MDPQIALCNWVLYRGDRTGFLFCNVVGTECLRVIHYEPWGRDSYVGFIRCQMGSIGIPAARVKKITGIVLGEEAYTSVVPWSQRLLHNALVRNQR